MCAIPLLSFPASAGLPLLAWSDRVALLSAGLPTHAHAGCIDASRDLCQIQVRCRNNSAGGVLNAEGAVTQYLTATTGFWAYNYPVISVKIATCFVIIAPPTARARVSPFTILFIEHYDVCLQ